MHQSHSLPSFTRADVVALARAWIGTPYHHQASAIGVGTDCLGLVRGLYRTLHGDEPQPVPGYARDWAEATCEETMLAAARRHLIEIDAAAAQPGDVLVFRYRRRYSAKHAAVLAGATLIHAVEGAPVGEVPFNAWWRRRIAGAFSFPGIID
jgi:NlpC/P60 family putative phage cell wall peptidase